MTRRRAPAPARPPAAPPAPSAADVARQRARVGQARLVAAVLAATAVLWLGAQWLGGRLGWEARYAFLIDFAAIGAFVWCMAVAWRVMRAG